MHPEETLEMCQGLDLPQNVDTLWRIGTKVAFTLLTLPARV